jgi:HPt (histidine-containing phosphotransfer) domain-containing protein
MKGDRERCLESGSDEYLSKPIQIRQLLETLERVLAPRSPPAAEPKPYEERVAPRNTAAPAPKNGVASGGPEIWSKVAALRSTGGDRGLLCELIESFLTERPKLMANLELALETSDPDRLQFAAHVLKGSMRCFHAPEAMKPAEELETRGRTRNLAGVTAPYEQLREAVDRLTAALAEFIDEEVKVKPK